MGETGEKTGRKTGRKARKLLSCAVYGFYIVYYYAAYVIGLAARRLPYYRNMWLIAERKTEARDNGLHFFRYLTKNHPEINAAFIIDRNSPDFERVNSLGKVIQPNTFSHMLAFACAKIRISTHYMSCSPDAYRFAVLNRFGLAGGKNAVIRHGITSNDLKELHYPNARPDLLVCSSVPEYESMKNSYGHPDGVIQKIGLCRYDRLLSPHEVKRQILVMPTWRYFLRNLSDEEFMKTEYYKQFSRLINDRALLDALEKNDYTISFYLHYELQPYSRLFKPESPRVRILKKESADVQDLLMESSVLVTDYSSVFFDFSYMEKPIVYLQFDEEEFFATQYGRGYFDCHRDGFGPVFDDAGPVAEFLCEKIESGAAVDDVYIKRINKFFGERRADHCEKTYNAIEKFIT